MLISLAQAILYRASRMSRHAAEINVPKTSRTPTNFIAIPKSIISLDWAPQSIPNQDWFWDYFIISQWKVLARGKHPLLFRGGYQQMILQYKYSPNLPKPKSKIHLAILISILKSLEKKLLNPAKATQAPHRWKHESRRWYFLNKYAWRENLGWAEGLASWKFWSLNRNFFASLRDFCRMARISKNPKKPTKALWNLLKLLLHCFAALAKRN